jgi:hypothetical protein
MTTRIEGTWEPDEWHVADPARLPRVGDLIVMELPRTAPCPPGFSRGGSVAWKFSDGTETGFPYRAHWWAGYELVER